MLSYSDMQRVFSREVLLSLAEHRSNDFFKNALQNNNALSSLGLFEDFYCQLVENYKSDFVFRSLIAQKIFLGMDST